METRKFFVLAASICVISLFSCGETPPYSEPIPPPDQEEKDPEKYEVKLSKSKLSIDAFKSAAQSISVTTESKLWKVDAEDEWLTAIKSDGTITISADDNLNPQSRKGVVEISGDDVKAPVSIEVNQEGVETTLSVSTESVTFLCTDNSSKSKELLVTSDKNIWQAALESDEYFTLSVRDNRITVSPKSVNESEDPCMTKLIVSAGMAAEPVEVNIMQKGVVTYKTFFAEWQVSGNPAVRIPPGPASWNSTFEPVSGGNDQWYVSWNFGGLKEAYLPLKYTGESLQIEDWMQALVPQNENIRAYIRIMYFDENDGRWDANQPVLGQWDGVNKTISFSKQIYHNIDGKMYDAVIVVAGYDLVTAALLGTYTDGYSDLTFTRGNMITPTRAGYAPYSLTGFEHPDDTARLEALKAASAKTNGRMTRAELMSKRLELK